MVLCSDAFSRKNKVYITFSIFVIARWLYTSVLCSCHYLEATLLGLSVIWKSCSNLNVRQWGKILAGDLHRAFVGLPSLMPLRMKLMKSFLAVQWLRVADN